MGIQTFDSIEIRDDIENEVENVRTGYDGTVYQSAGDSVRGQIGNLYTEIGKNLLTLVLIDGQYVNTSGALSNGASFSYTNPVPVQEGDIVQLKAAGYSTNVSMIYTCESDNTNKVPVVISSGADVGVYEYVVDNDGYVGFSFNHTKHYAAFVYNEDSIRFINDKIESYGVAIDNLLAKQAFTKSDYEQGVWTNGAKVNSGFRIRTKDAYETEQATIIKVFPNGMYANLQVYKTRTVVDDEASFSDLIAISGWTNQEYTTTVPPGCYIINNVAKTYPNNSSVSPIENVVDVYVADNQIAQNEYDIERIDSEIAEIRDDMPDYWVSEINDTKTKITSNRLSMGSRNVEFMFITDIHWSGNAKKSPTLINYLHRTANIDLLLIGGDVIYTHQNSQSAAADEINEFYSEFDKTLRTISTIGNHDLNSNSNPDTTSYLSDQQLYNLMMKQEECYADTFASPYVTVYDNESQKARIIQFYHPDTVPIPQSAKTAVINAVTEKDNDWTVFVMCHVYWSGNAIDQYISAFVAELSQLNADNSHAFIGALICGHTHYDDSEVVGGNLLIINTQCDIYRQSTGAPMALGTSTEQSFDVFQIDLETKTINITKVGAGNDRQFSY